MAVTGKNTLTLRKRDLSNEKAVSVGFSKLQAWHKATAGETGIDLLSLNFPSEITSAAQPSLSKLSGAQLRKYAANVTVTSSLRGILMRGLAYTIPNATRINFKDFTAEQDEIFEIVLDHETSTELTLVDGSKIAATGDLADGVTDFNVGVPFTINENPNTQIGNVLVFRNGFIQFRNPGNGTTGGNYQEVDPGGGLGIIIRFNDAPVGSDDAIIVTSNGIVAERPVVSQQADIEHVQGQVDAMIPTLAALAEVDETDFQAAPNNIDLKAFGDEVLRLEQDKHDKFEILHQTKVMTTNDDLTQLEFNNLEAGKTYRIGVALYILNVTSDDVIANVLNTDGSVIGAVGSTQSLALGENQQTTDFVSFIFTAPVGGSITYFFTVGTGLVSAASGRTFATLEELPNHITTAKWI